MTELCQYNVHARKWHLAYFVPNVLRYELRNFGKTGLELGIGGEGQDTSRHFEGSFGSRRAILPM